MSEPLLIAQHLARRYGARVAVEDVTLRLERGEVLGLLGLNGAGKSTTLRMLAGVLAPHRGTVTLHGCDLARAPLAAKRHLGYLPEIPPLFPDATVDEYLAFCARLHAVPAARVAASVARARARCHLQDVGTRVIRNLSKGFQQRVGIAQAIVHEPAVLILDEPTVGLDPAQIREVRELVRALRDEHAVLLSTHLLNEAESTCSRVAILHEGRIVYDADPAAAPRAVRIAFKSPPPLTALQATLGDVHVQGLPDGGYDLVTADPDAALARLIAAAARERWNLCEISTGRSTLERTFLEVTRDHVPRAASA
ncbi:MAG: ABC transporter ATP-binding protein [Gammaproteobacteria bacterium]